MNKVNKLYLILLLGAIVALIVFVKSQTIYGFVQGERHLVAARSSRNLIVTDTTNWPGATDPNCVQLYNETCRMDPETIKCGADPLNNKHMKPFLSQLAACSLGTEETLPTCNDYYECRVVDNTCVTVINKSRYLQCEICGAKCFGIHNWQEREICFRSCIAK